MKSNRWIGRSLCALAALPLAGCYAPAPYGYTTYPGYYGGSPQGGYVVPQGAPVAPGGAYPVPSTLGPPATMPGSPGPGSWNPSPAGPTPAGPPGAFGGGRPQANFGPPIGSATRPSDIPVPTPRDELGPDRPIDRPPGRPLDNAPLPQNPTPFSSDPNGPQTFRKDGDGQTRIDGPQRVEAGPQQVASAGNDSFESPMERAASLDARDARGGISAESRTVVGKNPGDSPNPYDYDRKGYTYLRGVVDWDAKDRTWCITYNLKPNTKDLYDGVFVLADHPRLAGLHGGDFVFIEGHPSRDQFEKSGKPKYEITNEVVRMGPQDNSAPRGTSSMAN